MIRALALLLALSLPAAAQETPTISVDLEPDGPVTVGTPVSIAITVLVPTYMPAPPAWPDLQIADAVTRLHGRATQPVTRRIGNASWSGLTRTYEIIPQRAAGYDLADATMTVIWAGADNSPQSATLPVPDIAFAATIPAGARNLDPFVAASTLTVTAKVEGLLATLKPGDALTLTLTTTASGPPAMLLPPLAERIETPAGLRAYPKQPTLTDTPGERGGPPSATRVETITYVIEAPGNYVLPAISLDWWNTGSRSVASATTEAVTFEVAVPPGWQAAASGDRHRHRTLWIAASLAVLTIIAGGLILWRRWKAKQHEGPPTERRVYRDLRRAVREKPPGTLRTKVLDWMRCASPTAAELTPDIETLLLALERSAYGSSGGSWHRSGIPNGERRALLTALAERRKTLRSRKRTMQRRGLPALNPAHAAEFPH
ncbi:MAG TPA: hypothetical protein PKA33_20585 [Amaricoccus sp.]|uniref:hypothetical protein n=1 Tax=Amaricoccus sp. TaxID=1872485 RepID=UPI002C3F379B|nr:hypothetical protein [Amaricoccus sp.]HMR54714.1 hypothetical protein [Amaricoccus sp.]HMU01730.1 hypothetical protein [Amaricoccus sp.]